VNVTVSVSTVVEATGRKSLVPYFRPSTNSWVSSVDKEIGFIVWLCTMPNDFYISLIHEVEHAMRTRSFDIVGAATPINFSIYSEAAPHQVRSISGAVEHIFKHSGFVMRSFQLFGFGYALVALGIRHPDPFRYLRYAYLEEVIHLGSEDVFPPVNPWSSYYTAYDIIEDNGILKAISKGSEVFVPMGLYFRYMNWSNTEGVRSVSRPEFTSLVLKECSPWIDRFLGSIRVFN